MRRLAWRSELALGPSATACWRCSSAILELSLVRGIPAVDPLQQALQARFIGVSFRTRGGGAKSMSIKADEANDMTQVRRYTDELALGSDEITREYEYRTVHALDGYVESATFEITLSNGSLRVGARSSEVAIENLRRNVIALFPPPQ